MKPELYKIKLSKKSGVPDLDLPGVQLKEKIKDANFLNFSIVIEDIHVVIKSQKQFNDSVCSNLKSFTHGKEEMLLMNDEVPVKKRKCCCFYF
jgi:hypothetical protein